MITFFNFYQTLYSFIHITSSDGKKQPCRWKFSEIENFVDFLPGQPQKHGFLFTLKYYSKKNVFRHISFNKLVPLNYSTSNDKKKDFVKNWPSNSNLCFEKHWFSIIFGDEKLRVFNFYLKNY